MSERPGDKPIEQRVNEGASQLSDFSPDEGNRARDAHSAIMNSPIRQAVYFGLVSRPQHASTRRDPEYRQGVKLPGYVVVGIIQIEGRKWDYKTPTNHPALTRRVFIERDQSLELDLRETLIWLNASEGSKDYTKTRENLIAESNPENVNNQAILQMMYERTQSGLPMLPASVKTPKKIKRTS